MVEIFPSWGRGEDLFEGRDIEWSCVCVWSTVVVCCIQWVAKIKDTGSFFSSSAPEVCDYLVSQCPSERAAAKQHLSLRYGTLKLLAMIISRSQRNCPLKSGQSPEPKVKTILFINQFNLVTLGSTSYDEWENRTELTYHIPKERKRAVIG